MRLFVYLLIFVVHVTPSYGQTENAPLKVTMCDLYENPEQYAGKMVEFRASVRFDFALDDFSNGKTCSAYMITHLEYPENVRPNPNFNIVRDKAFNEFVESLQQGMNVEATYVGRFDPMFFWRDQKRIRVGHGTEKGYGKKRRYDGRIVLQRVSDVRALRIPRK